MLGLRPVERLAADRLGQAGHHVTMPDLYGGRAATNMNEGYALMNAIGWPAITQRAREGLHAAPAEAVLMGVSMGVGVVGAIWPERPQAAGVVFLHAVAAIPASVQRGLRLQVHAGEADDFAPPAEIAVLRAGAAEAGVAAEVFTYPGVGHFYTDASQPEYDARATDLTWTRILGFLV